MTLILKFPLLLPDSLKEIRRYELHLYFYYISCKKRCFFITRTHYIK